MPFGLILWFMRFFLLGFTAFFVTGFVCMKAESEVSISDRAPWSVSSEKILHSVHNQIKSEKPQARFWPVFGLLPKTFRGEAPSLPLIFQDASPAKSEVSKYFFKTGLSPPSPL